MSALGVVHLVYNALRNLPFCVECVELHSFLQLYGVRIQGTVQIRTADIRECHSHEIVCHDLEKDLLSC